MDISYFLGRTFVMRCAWIRVLRRKVRSGAFPPAYEKAVENLVATYFLRSLAMRHWRRLLTGFSPMEFLVAITDWCPYKEFCQYCYNCSKDKKPLYIDLAKLDIILDEMKAVYGVQFAVITGGEPFPYVLELAARRPDFTFFAYTGGNISKETCAALVSLGNIIPALTIVDVDPLVHDFIRGPGSLARVLQARQYLREFGLPWGFSFTSSRINFEQIIHGGLLEKLVALEPHFIRAMPWMPTGYASDNLVLTLEQMAVVGEKIRVARLLGTPILDYVTAPEGYPCLAGGERSFFLAPSEDGGIRVSPCVFMEEKISVPLKFSADDSDLRLVLKDHPWFVHARGLARKTQCIIHANRQDWDQLIKNG